MLQAPQRERVTQATKPASKRRIGKGVMNWKANLTPEVNLGVPHVMMMLEPNVVFDHVQARGL